MAARCCDSPWPPGRLSCHSVAQLVVGHQSVSLLGAHVPHHHQFVDILLALSLWCGAGTLNCYRQHQVAASLAGCQAAHCTQLCWWLNSWTPSPVTLFHTAPPSYHCHDTAYIAIRRLLLQQLPSSTESRTPMRLRSPVLHQQVPVQEYDPEFPSALLSLLQDDPWAARRQSDSALMHVGPRAI
eukprot:GHUV01039227.1.p1 GENE.GHUV01039227.1~~GHUV01039227.1.p1  ORF type:complete len:184 (-),score=21.52 GHUV01039227.1:333-884(-)